MITAVSRQNHQDRHRDRSTKHSDIRQQLHQVSREVKAHRKVNLEDKENRARNKAKNLTNYAIYLMTLFLREAMTIGKTLLVEMDIDTGGSPQLPSKPYTLSLKHYDWVQKEITTLEKAGIITKSISPWASLVVIVPKKLGPGEPPQRRMCVDFRRLNKQLPEVKNMSGCKGCISLVPLPKIDKLYAKLQRLQGFQHPRFKVWILPHRSFRQC